jgi:phosphoribosylaminoimidazole-succinocarboxamide synthase
MDMITETDLQGLRVFKKGKVRDVYDLDDKAIIVATDRISAFDVVLPTPIPEKGKILTRICKLWFDLTERIIENHLITMDIADFPAEAQAHEKTLQGRSMLVKKAKVIPIECVVRGWLAGSGWKEYKKRGSVCGVKLPEGLVESSKLPRPIFTPTTKATKGHDMPLSYAEMEGIVGRETAEFLRSKSFELYGFAAEYAEKRGIIIADTKFEFGRLGDDIVLVDELFTPDSSRYWPIADYEPGRSQKSFDKQFVRDYLEKAGWKKKPPAPELPADIAKKTSQKYLEAEKIIRGKAKPPSKS